MIPWSSLWPSETYSLVTNYNNTTLQVRYSPSWSASSSGVLSTLRGSFLLLCLSPAEVPLLHFWPSVGYNTVAPMNITVHVEIGYRWQLWDPIWMRTAFIGGLALILTYELKYLSNTMATGTLLWTYLYLYQLYSVPVGRIFTKTGSNAVKQCHST